jgi:high-affinity iron transporter
MFKIAIVIFREFLEIAILLGIVLAATKNLSHRSSYIIAGVLIGLVGASLLGFFATQLSSSFGGMGDEIFNVGIILLTVFVLGWTAVWMKGYSTQIKEEMSLVASKIEKGNAHKVILTLMVAGTIFREGSEVVLFIYSFASSSQSLNAEQYLLGFTIGSLGGLLVGTWLYLGLLKFAGRYVFKVCFVLLIFIASGLAAEAAGILTSSGFINVLTERAWDSSWIVADHSIVGRLLKILVGYESKPNIMQLLFYCTTLLVLCLCSYLQSRRISTKR